ncbi:hypothetical protein HPB47_009630, partial [Ixodes persulcatus]
MGRPRLWQRRRLLFLHCCSLRLGSSSVSRLNNWFFEAGMPLSLAGAAAADDVRPFPFGVTNGHPDGRRQAEDGHCVAAGGTGATEPTLTRPGRPSSRRQSADADPDCAEP